VCILRDAEVGLCVKRVVSYDNLDSIKVSLIEKIHVQDGENIKRTPKKI
jgi:hypothetical protein